MHRTEPHPLSTQMLLERAATASTEPDHHHVEAAYRAARAVALLTEDDCPGPDFDYEVAADVAALEMALAAASALARRIYDNHTEHHDHLAPWLHRIVTHFADQLGHVADDLERHAGQPRRSIPTHLPT